MVAITHVGSRIRFCHWRVLTRLLWQSTSRLKPRRILDLGSGKGYYSLDCARLFPNSSVIGIDISLKRLLYYREHKPNNLHCIRADMQHLPIDSNSKFELILCIEVLEHIERDVEVFGKMVGLLAEDGLIIIHVPLINRRYPFFNPLPDHLHARDGYSYEFILWLAQQQNIRLIEKRRTFAPWLGTLAGQLSLLTMQGRAPSLFHGLISFLVYADTNTQITEGNGMFFVFEKTSKVSTKEI